MIVLETVGLSKSFERLQALKDVTLKLEAGEIVGLIGPNGAGKTTLVNLISGALPATAGDIRFHGRSIRALKPYQIARLGIGRTYQIVPDAAGMSALDYATIGALFGRADGKRTIAAARREAERALEMVGLASDRTAPAGQLNLVDRKRMELARVLAMRPSLMLLDEIMAGLDPNDIERILDVVRELRGTGITVFVIEHIVEAVASIADRIVVLVLGEVLIQDKPDVVLRDDQVHEAYLGSRYSHGSGG